MRVGGSSGILCRMSNIDSVAASAVLHLLLESELLELSFAKMLYIINILIAWFLARAFPNTVAVSLSVRILLQICNGRFSGLPSLFSIHFRGISLCPESSRGILSP